MSLGFESYVILCAVLPWQGRSRQREADPSKPIFPGLIAKFCRLLSEKPYR